MTTLTVAETMPKRISEAEYAGFYYYVYQDHAGEFLRPQPGQPNQCMSYSSEALHRWRLAHQHLWTPRIAAGGR